MLVSLYVKNLALIAESEIAFGPKLNILTGETGAGKSILIGSINLALGAKADKDLIRNGKEYALVELTFFTEDANVIKKMEELELPVEEGTIIISRKIQATRSISKINGETVTTKQIKELAELLIDIHGQHEHQSLLNKKKHLEILDAYAGEELEKVLNELAHSYKACKQLKEKMEEESLDENARKREMDLAEFEWKEIEEAHLISGEDAELEARYRKMINSKKIGESIAVSYRLTGYEELNSAGSQIGRALKEMHNAASYDENLEELTGQLEDIEALLNDFNRDTADYMEDLEFDEEDFKKTEERLNQLNHLKGKYDADIEGVIAYGQNRQKQIEKLADYEVYMEKLRREQEEAERKLREICDKATQIRKKHAKSLEQTLLQALEELNFLSVEFAISVEEKPVSMNGCDDVEFLISTNPGEMVKPLGQVASGGELSRVMLAIKTVMARKDAIQTLIFDEIDAGISGKTAWKVSEKLGALSESHQILCITHLPQIAAMADTHFLIEKNAKKDGTSTSICELDREASMHELARLLGSDVITEAALSNASEMKEQAKKQKGK